MSAITLRFETDNAAFDEEEKNQEIARILKALAARFEDGQALDSDGWIIRDINGNKIGMLEIN